MRRLLLAAVLCVMAASAYGEEASVVPVNDLHLGQNYSFGFAGGGVSASWGFGAVYGLSDWLNLQLFWDTFLDARAHAGSGSLFLGVKGYLVGHGALVPTESRKLRLSAAFGLFVPPMYPEPDLLSQDQLLWGSSLRLYGDIIVRDFFYINAYFEGSFYPPQYQSGNTAEHREWVRHYQDFTFEIEAHFAVPAGRAVLRFGAPVRYFFAPYMNASYEVATSQSCLSSGAYFGVTLPDSAPQVEMYLRYNAHILGRNIRQVHTVSFLTNITLSPRSWFRTRDRAAGNGEPANGASGAGDANDAGDAGDANEE